MQFSQWYLVKEKGYEHGSIKRYRLDKKSSWQRYPIKHYKDLDKGEVESLIRRINATYLSELEATQTRYNFDHAYVNVKSIKAFEDYVASKASDPGHIRAVITWLQTYAFEFFIIKEKLPDPTHWHRKEVEWGKWLIEKKISAKTIREIISTTNRFIKHLSTRQYSNMPNPRMLEPIGSTKLKRIHKERSRVKSYISEESFKELMKDLKDEATFTEETNKKAYLLTIQSVITLCYRLGLRISETQGLTKEKFFKTHVFINEQGDRKGTRSRVKTDCSIRKVPYWYLDGKEAWNLVKQMTPMHASNLDSRVNDWLKKYGYFSHDLRGSFVTNALRDHHWRDVQKAVGHTDVRTTMSYARDDRGLNDERLELD